MKTTELNAPVEKEPRDKRPVVISFALVKRENFWNAIVLKSKGREIIDEKVLESDDSRMVAEDALDVAEMGYRRHGIDPFEPKRKAL